MMNSSLDQSHAMLPCQSSKCADAAVAIEFERGAAKIRLPHDSVRHLRTQQATIFRLKLQLCCIASVCSRGWRTKGTCGATLDPMHQQVSPMQRLTQTAPAICARSAETLKLSSRLISTVYLFSLWTQVMPATAVQNLSN